MRDRKPFDLKGPLALWNLGLAVFSFMGAMRTVPQLLNNLYQNDFYYSICEPAPRTFGLGAAGMWVTLFIFSKMYVASAFFSWLRSTTRRYDSLCASLAHDILWLSLKALVARSRYLFDMCGSRINIFGDSMPICYC